VFDNGATGVEVTLIVCQVEKVYFLSKENPLFGPHRLRGGHSCGP
jgi:hypothetical protein